MTMAIPILNYHHVNPLEGDMVTVSVNHFEEQMSFLKRKDYHTLFVSELVEWMQGKRKVPKKSVVLSFDDGFWDNYKYAFPILKKYGLKATIFIVTGWISEERNPGQAREVIPHHQVNQLIAQGRGDQIAMTWPEAKEMQESGLIEMESHTHSHNKELYQNTAALKDDLDRSPGIDPKSFKQKQHLPLLARRPLQPGEYHGRPGSGLFRPLHHGKGSQSTRERSVATQADNR